MSTTTPRPLPPPRRRRAAARPPSVVRPLRPSRLLLVACLGLLAVRSVSSDSDPSLRRVFDAIDADGDGKIDPAEYDSAVERLLGSGGGAAGAGGGAAGASGGGGSGGTLGMEPRSSKSGAPLKDKLKFADPASTKAFVKGLFASFSAIMATEIGDKTFFIAAVLSMRNDRSAVFGGAILALVVMTILSTLMGLVLPNLLPRQYTHLIGGVLFLYFGAKLLLDSRGMEDKVSEELEEVEEELAEMNKKRSGARRKKRAEEKDAGASSGDDLEAGEEGGENGAKKRRGGGGGKSLKKAPSSSLSAAGDYSGASWEATFLQALTMTFLAEWGDRSQIATIALAAAKDPLGVTIGGCIGHSVCTGMAVVGGRMLAARISEKSVAFYGGLVFLAFGIHSAFFEE